MTTWEHSLTSEEWSARYIEQVQWDRYQNELAGICDGPVSDFLANLRVVMALWAWTEYVDTEAYDEGYSAGWSG